MIAAAAFFRRYWKPLAAVCGAALSAFAGAYFWGSLFAPDRVASGLAPVTKYVYKDKVVKEEVVKFKDRAVPYKVTVYTKADTVLRNRIVRDTLFLAAEINANSGLGTVTSIAPDGVGTASNFNAGGRIESIRIDAEGHIQLKTEPKWKKKLRTAGLVLSHVAVAVVAVVVTAKADEMFEQDKK